MLMDLELMTLHVRALFTHDNDDRLLRVNNPNGGAAPRFFLGRTIAGSIRRYHRDLARDLVEAIEAVCIAEPPVECLHDPRDGDAATRYLETENDILSLLNGEAPVEKISRGPSYVFPKNFPATADLTTHVTERDVGVLDDGFEDWIPDVADSQPFIALVIDGRAVAVCCSVRITPEAHEAGVEVAEKHRGHGYAADVCSRWASEVNLLGCTALYSTGWENTASQAVARKLALRQYGVTFHAR
jgi:hypothetical protein